jgi:mannose-6-phosphate isomerase-like protein (cupin superfamily)
MNTTKIIKELKTKYPGKFILKNNEKNPTEIICEIEPTQDHPDYSIAIAVIDKSILHFHKKTIEEYEVLKGTLTLFVGSKKIILNEGEKYTIPLNTIHHAEGHKTWIKTTSRPGWTKEDHILVE